MIFKIETDTLELLVQYIHMLKENLNSLRGQDKKLTFKNIIQGSVESVITVRNAVLKNYLNKMCFLMLGCATRFSS